MVDVTVRGAGIFGLSIAWACVQHGASVQVVDPFGPAAGSSGGIVGALAPHVPENWNEKKAFQLDSLLMADAFWQDVEHSGGQSAGYLRNGRLQPITDDHALDLAKARCETAKSLWGDAAHWRVIETSNDPWTPHAPTGLVIHDTLSARIHPRHACLALVSALAAKGVAIAPDAPDEGRVLWATGVSGLEQLNANHHRMVGNGVKGQAALFDCDMRAAPQLFVDGLHIVPHFDGTVAIGSTSERDFDEPTTTDHKLDELIEKARAAVAALQNSNVIDRWAGVRPRTRSRAPMLGPWPNRPGHYIANGGFKIGFGMAPKVAHVMADLLLEDSDAIPDPFRVGASL